MPFWSRDDTSSPGGGGGFEMDPSTFPTAQDYTELRAISVAFLILTWITFSLRLAVRGFIMKALRWDDAFLLLSQALWTIFAAGGFLLVHLQSNPALLAIPANLKTLQNWIIVCTLAYYLTMVTLKTSISLTFVRLFWHEKWKVHAIYLCLALTVVSGLVCSVLAGIYLSTFNPNAAGTTVNTKFDNANLVFGAINTAVDIITAAFACMAIASTKMSLSDRISAILLVLLGSSGCILSIVRLSVVSRYSASSNPAAGIRTEKWSLVESGVCIVAVSLMACRPLLASARKRLGFASTKGSSSYGNFGVGNNSSNTALKGVNSNTGRGASRSAPNNHDSLPPKADYHIRMATINKEVTVEVV